MHPPDTFAPLRHDEECSPRWLKEARRGSLGRTLASLLALARWQGQGQTLSTHPINTPIDTPIDSKPLNTPLNPSSQHTLTTHPYNTPLNTPFNPPLAPHLPVTNRRRQSRPQQLQQHSCPIHTVSILLPRANTAVSGCRWQMVSWQHMVIGGVIGV